jgi:plasmid maintenance system antidote protein VapI
MEKEPGLQHIFFQQIRNQVPDNLSFVHEVADVLGISYDSAYRRIRGEKELNLDEMLKLGTRFGVSIDSVFNLKGNNVVFRHHGLQSTTEKISEWLPLIYHDFLQATKAQSIDIIYAAKDPPIYQYFQFPEIAAFKFFFWRKTLFEDPEHEGKLFRLDETDSEDILTGDKLLEAAIKLPTTEIWNEDTFNMFSRQIEYYWISGYFERRDDLLNIVDKLEKWVRHMQKQAGHGFKFIYGKPAEGPEN